MWPDPAGLWYNEKSTFADLTAGWAQLARRMCRHWNVFGADIFNEPHGGSWGTGNAATDWDAAAEELGNGVLKLCRRWVVFVEGIGQDGVRCGISILGHLRLSPHTRLVPCSREAR